MKATFVLAGMDTYGGDRVLARYALGLRRLGWRVGIITVAPPRNPLFYEDLPVRSLDVPGFPSGRQDYVRALGRILRSTRDAGTVVAAWTPVLPLAVALRGAGQATRVVWLQQDYPEMFEGLPFERALLRHGASLTDVTVAVSAACALHAGGPSTRIRVLHSGLEERFFLAANQPRPTGLNRPPDLLFVGDPIERKGWPELTQALAVLRGWGVEHRLTVVMRRAPGVPVPPKTRVALAPDDDALASLYRSADVLVCASRQEGWGLPALEAMATGTPVVSTLHDGCRAYARPGVNLLGVRVGDAEGLAAAIRDVLARPGLSNTLVAEGLRTARSYAWEGIVPLFAALAAGRHPPPFPWERPT